VKEKSNQYAPAPGLPELRQAIADHYSRHFGQSLEPRNICVTSGATEALASCILASLTPGDEVIIFTPAYDSYAPMIRRAGGIPVEIALHPPKWRIEKEALAVAITSKTRAILFNNPHNPTGRLFDAQELQVIANAAIEHDLVVIADEVWEHVLMDGQKFTPIATIPGMAERVLKVGSAGKIFSLTGWKIGWIAAAPELASLVTRAHQFLTFSSAPNLQWAVAFGMANGDAWIEPMQQRFARARDRMVAALHAAGFVTLPAASTYFLCVDLKASGIPMDDLSFAAEAVEKAGVAVIPLSAFYEQNALGISFASASASATKQSTPASPRWLRRRIFSPANRPAPATSSRIRQTTKQEPPAPKVGLRDSPERRRSGSSAESAIVLQSPPPLRLRTDLDHARDRRSPLRSRNCRGLRANPSRTACRSSPR
jgi:aspartate/methionine/tyrosine aminotransferase